MRNAILLPKEGLGELLWREVQEEYPSGIAQIAPATVLSAHLAGSCSVLPGRAGLAELVGTGALRITGMSRGIQMGEGELKPFTSPDRFRISEKLRLPAGATGTFTLPSQVPPPDGEFGDACVLAEPDMKPISGSRANCK